MASKKKIEPAISQHFSKLAKKSWAKRKQNILKGSGALTSKKVGGKNN